MRIGNQSEISRLEQEETEATEGRIAGLAEVLEIVSGEREPAVLFVVEDIFSVSFVASCSSIRRIRG
jgi:hypothetical protein